VLGGAVYPGGREVGHPVLKTAESWCESLGGGADASGWIEQPDMLEARENFGACCVEFGDGSDEFRVVAVGGTTHMNIVLKSAECFDGKAWCAMPPMSEPREGCSCAALPAGRCVVAGGSGDTIELFDFEQGAWTMLASMAVGRAFCGVCYANDHLFVGGGFASDWTSHASVEVLDVGLLEKNAGGGALKPLANKHRPVAQPVGVAADVAAVQSVEENLDSWLDKWTQMTEEEQEAFKKAEKEQYRRVQKGTSRGFSRIWDAKLKAVEAHKKRHASGFAKLKAVNAFGALGGGGGLGGLGGLGSKLEALKESPKPSPTPPTEAKPDTTPPPSPRGFKTVSVGGGSAAKQPAVDVIAKRRWRAIAPMTRPRRWMQLVVAELPDPTEEPEEPARPRIPTPTTTVAKSSAGLPPVPKVAQTPEEVAALLKQLSGLANKPEDPEDMGTKVGTPSAGGGSCG